MFLLGDANPLEAFTYKLSDYINTRGYIYPSVPQTSTVM